MNTIQKKKCLIILAIMLLLSMAGGCILYALKQNINLFYTPTELHHASLSPEKSVRIGGYVKKGSVRFSDSGESVSFIITDRKEELPVTYHGVLPNLFREGQGVVVTGKYKKENILMAYEVLAKHDEKYMPMAIREKIDAS